MSEDTSQTVETTATKPAKEKEIPSYRDEGFFTHITGDTYNGFFEIKKKDHAVKMMGTGVYKTAEGDVYTGTWDSDKLGGNEPVTITFVDTSTYVGPIKEWCYSGSGKYTYPDESELTCEFLDNCPTGKLTLKDPNGHVWLGKAEVGFGWFEPVNHFYMLLDKRDHPKMKVRRRSVLPK